MKMNFQLLIFLVGAIAIFSTLALIGSSEAQSSIPSNQLLSDSEVFIFVQVIAENSEGTLVSYLTSDKFTNLNLERLEILLDSEETEDDPIVTINDQKFQIIQRLLRVPNDEYTVVASTILVHPQNGTLKTVARFAHDGYPVLEGEMVTSGWTFIRPVD